MTSSEISTAAALVSRRIISWRGSGDEKGAAAGSVAAMHLVGLVYELGHARRFRKITKKHASGYERAAVEKGRSGFSTAFGDDL